MLNKKIIIFNHIPKTAGTSLRFIISDNYKNVKLYYARSGISKKDIEDLIVQKPSVIIGHFGFGLHNLLNINVKNVNYITMLRNPVERAISHYYEIKKINNLDIKAFIYDDQMHNRQTRFLSYGINLISNEIKECDEKMLELAKTNILNHYCFGLFDFYEESIINFSKKIKLKKIQSTKTKLSINKKENKEIDEKTKELIIDKNKFDIRLYEFALEVFNKNRGELKMEKIKEVLYFINAHRDGCTGSLVSESLKITTEEVLNLFKQMHKDGLIEINMANNPTDEEFINSLVMISGAYTDPRYSDIF